MLTPVVLAAIGLSAPSPQPSLAAALSHGNLDYTSPASRSDEGMPVGNGRMGSLIWTVPSASDNGRWWQEFWSRGYVAMHSDDGQADFVGGNYLYFLYLMASSSRGDYPPRFGGMLWYTTGDMRRWGSQFWHANTDAYYRDLLPSGHLALMAPFYSLYFGMKGACAGGAAAMGHSRDVLP